MADVLYGFDPGTVVTDAAGRPLINRRANIHKTYTGNSPFTATKAVIPSTLAVGLASAGSVTSDAQGRVGFYATDYYDTLWLDYGTGSRWPINLTKSSDRTVAVLLAIGGIPNNNTDAVVSVDTDGTRYLATAGSTGISLDVDGTPFVASTGGTTGIAVDTDGTYYFSN